MTSAKTSGGHDGGLPGSCTVGERWRRYSAMDSLTGPAGADPILFGMGEELRLDSLPGRWCQAFSLVPVARLVAGHTESTPGRICRNQSASSACGQRRNHLQACDTRQATCVAGKRTAIDAPNRCAATPTLVRQLGAVRARSPARSRWARGTPRKSDRPSGDSDPTSDVPVALPIGPLAGEEWVVRRRLHVPMDVERPRGDRVFARPGRAPVEGPELPGIAA